MKRYALGINPKYAPDAPDGEWILFNDHAAEVEALKKQVKKLANIHAGWILAESTVEAERDELRSALLAAKHECEKGHAADALVGINAALLK